MKKNFINLMLALVMVTAPLQVSAAENETTNNVSYTEEAGTEEFEQSVDITGSKGGEFVIAVPKTSILTDGEDNSLKVGVYADIPSTKKIVIEPVDETPETADKINFVLQNIVAEGVTPRDDIVGSITTKKTEFAWDDESLCESAEVISVPENMVEICTYRADIAAGEWQGNVRLSVSLTDAETSEIPGLYGADGVMLCSWEESGINVETDYTSSNYATETTSPYYVLTNNYTTATRVVLPDTLTNIGNYAFYECDSLKSIDVQEGIDTIGCFAFAECSALQEMLLPESLTNLGFGSFNNDSNLTHVTMHENITTVKYAQNTGDPTKHSFYGCNNLTSVGGIGSGCSIELDMTSIPSSIFAYATSLTSIIIPDNVTSIGQEVISGCTNLTSATFENTSNWYVGNSVGSTDTAINSSDLSNTSTANTYLKSTYKLKFWTRSE